MFPYNFHHRLRWLLRWDLASKPHIGSTPNHGIWLWLFLAVREVGGEGFNEPMMCLLAYPTVLIWDSKSVSTSTQGTTLRVFSKKSDMESEVSKGLFCCSVGEKKRKAGVFESRYSSVSTGDTVSVLSTQNKMPGTWKFHRLKSQEDHLQKSGRPFSWMCFKVMLYFLPWDSSLIVQQALGRKFVAWNRICWLVYFFQTFLGPLIMFHPMELIFFRDGFHL